MSPFFRTITAVISMECPLNSFKTVPCEILQTRTRWSLLPERRISSLIPKQPWGTQCTQVTKELWPLKTFCSTTEALSWSMFHIRIVLSLLAVANRLELPDCEQIERTSSLWPQTSPSILKWGLSMLQALQSFVSLLRKHIFSFREVAHVNAV